MGLGPATERRFLAANERSQLCRRTSKSMSSWPPVPTSNWMPILAPSSSSSKKHSDCPGLTTTEYAVAGLCRKRPKRASPDEKVGGRGVSARARRVGARAGKEQ